ncbi:MAG: globin domain-containing protein [Micrococcus sp.]|nr:globin domain-containing protein [Micrococcus sp.]
MLSEKSRPVIEATAAVVAEHMPQITPKFYAHMFAAHPELLNGTFSRANQRNGEQAQALAGSVVHFAVHLLEHPDTLPEAVLARIAHKHTSLGVTADQYQIVYENLFWAIAEVLGDAVTPEVAEAWTEVYWLMADALIRLEKGLYARQANTALWSPWSVAAREETGTRAVTLRLIPADDTPVTPAAPGQYVSVRLPVADGLVQARQYSLSAHAESAQERVITVKRDDDGEVSPLLVNTLQVGDTLEVSNPYGEITLDDAETPLTLLTAGIGITPAAALLDTLTRAGSTRTVTLLHADASWEDVALRDQVLGAVEALPNASAELWLERGASEAPTSLPVHAGFLNLEDAAVPVSDDATIILCGPLPFMQATRSALIERGVPATNIAYEIFGPDLWLAS